MLALILSLLPFLGKRRKTNFLIFSLVSELLELSLGRQPNKLEIYKLEIIFQPQQTRLLSDPELGTGCWMLGPGRAAAGNI